jgi:integrase
MARTAAAVMMLAATGVRANELLSLERGGLERCVRGVPTWRVSGTVCKFHGPGVPAKWICGDLGRRAFRMLERLSDEPGRLLAGRRGIRSAQRLNELLREWMRAQDWRDSAGRPRDLHSHQFRRTVARQLIRCPEMNLFALRDHYKHRSVVMTDYYVGCDAELRAILLREKPTARVSAFNREMMREAGLEDAA